MADVKYVGVTIFVFQQNCAHVERKTIQMLHRETANLPLLICGFQEVGHESRCLKDLGKSFDNVCMLRG